MPQTPDASSDALSQIPHASSDAQGSTRARAWPWHWRHRGPRSSSARQTPQPHDETRHAPWLLAAKLPREGRQPLGDRRGIVVDYVVDTATAVLYCRHRRLRGVGDVDERPHAAAVADQREPALADHLIEITAGRHVCAWPVETAVTQHDALGPPRIEDCLLEMKDRGSCFALLAWGRQVERGPFALHRSAGARVQGVVALRHEPPHPHRLSGREQVIRPRAAQAVGHCDAALEATHAPPCKCSQLMDEHVRLRLAHRFRNLIGIERVRHHRHSAQLVEHRPLRLATRHAMNLVTRPNQTRHQLLPDRPSRSCDKHPHHQPLLRGFYLHPKRQDGSPGCDTSERPAHERVAILQGTAPTFALERIGSGAVSPEGYPVTQGALYGKAARDLPPPLRQPCVADVTGRSALSSQSSAGSAD